MAETSIAELNRIERIRSAALELLEALQWLEGYLRDTPHHNAPAAANARATIAKATEGEL